MRWAVVWAFCAGASQASGLAPEPHELKALYEAGAAQVDLTPDWDDTARPFVALEGGVRVYKHGSGYVARDVSGHRPALCSLQLAMTLRAISQTCRGLARPDHLRVMDTAIGDHVAFIAANHRPERPFAEVRHLVAMQMSDEFLRLKDRSICTAGRMADWIGLVALIDNGSFEAELSASLSAPRLPAAAPCDRRE